jgi:HSP20 family protein
MKLPPLRRTTAEWLDQIRQEMDQLLHRFLREKGEQARESALGWSPQVDVEETDREIIVTIDLPGVDPQDIEIALVERSLLVQGKKEERRDEARRNFHLAEREVGRFHRSIPLPAGADPEHVQAITAKGVLTITIPKKPEVQPRRIPVQGD